MWFYLDSLSSGVHGPHLDEAKSGWDNPGVFFLIYIIFQISFGGRTQHDALMLGSMGGRSLLFTTPNKRRWLGRAIRRAMCGTGWQQTRVIGKSLCMMKGRGQKGRLVTFHRLPVEGLICYCCFALFSLHGLWDLNFLTRGWTQAIVVKVLGSNHWITRDFPRLANLNKCSLSRV